MLGKINLFKIFKYYYLNYFEILNKFNFAKIFREDI